MTDQALTALRTGFALPIPPLHGTTLRTRRPRPVRAAVGSWVPIQTARQALASKSDIRGLTTACGARGAMPSVVRISNIFSMAHQGGSDLCVPRSAEPRRRDARCNGSRPANLRGPPWRRGGASHGGLRLRSSAPPCQRRRGVPPFRAGFAERELPGARPPEAIPPSGRGPQIYRAQMPPPAQTLPPLAAKSPIATIGGWRGDGVAGASECASPPPQNQAGGARADLGNAPPLSILLWAPLWDEPAARPRTSGRYRRLFASPGSPFARGARRGTLL